MAKTALDRLVGRLADGPARRPPARLAVPALAAVLAIVGAALALQPPAGSQQNRGQASGAGAVPPTATPDPVAVAATREPSPGLPTPTRMTDFWEIVSSVGEAAPYRSLTDLGERSEAIVVGSFSGEVEPGREPCDEESLAAGVPRGQACVSFANLPFRIEEVLAGTLPEQYRETVRIEYQADPARQAALVGTIPTDARFVLFIGSKYLRRFDIQDVYYVVGGGRGTFRDVDGRVVPLGLPDDPQFGRLEGMPFEQFIDLVRRVPILDLMPEG